MNIMVFKLRFYGERGGLCYTNLIKTITIDSSYSYGEASPNLQSAIDRVTNQLKEEGYSKVRLSDIQNISTPIIKRKY